MRFPENAVAAVAFLFESENGRKLSEFELDEIRRHELEDSDPSKLAAILKKSVQNEKSSDTTYRQQIYWALGKKFDHKLIPFFRKRLSLEIQRDMEAAYQIMIALDNLDEPVFSEKREEYVITEYEQNKLDAELYLKRTEQQL